MNTLMCRFHRTPSYKQIFDTFVKTHSITIVVDTPYMAQHIRSYIDSDENFALVGYI